jgi:F-type H+-transporting ATPase subunit b
MEILNQLAGLILGSLPTVFFFVVLVAAYGFLVRRPLDKVLLERRARTSGAVDQARGAMTAAEAETAVFEDKLRVARRELSQARDARVKQWAEERERVLSAARAETESRVRAARESLDASAASARHGMEGMSEELSAQVLRAVLPAGANVAEAAQ